MKIFRRYWHLHKPAPMSNDYWMLTLKPTDSLRTEEERITPGGLPALHQQCLLEGMTQAMCAMETSASALDLPLLHLIRHRYRRGCHGGTSTSGMFLKKVLKLGCCSVWDHWRSWTPIQLSHYLSGFQHWPSDTELPSYPDPSAELVGVRVTRWERHYPDLILSNLHHPKHIQGSQPSCFQFKAVLAELALCCCNTDKAKRKKNKIWEGFEHFPEVLQKLHLCNRKAQTVIKKPQLQKGSRVLTFSACEWNRSYVPCTTEWWACIRGLAMILLSGRQFIYTRCEHWPLCLKREGKTPHQQAVSSFCLQ